MADGQADLRWLETLFRERLARLGLVAEALPERFNETAYALACDIAAADGAVNMSELKLLEIVRHDLRVGRLAAAAIERAARAKHQRF